MPTLPGVERTVRRRTAAHAAGTAPVLYLGIDPGASGGIAVLRSQDATVLLPLGNLTEQQVWEAISGWGHRPRGGVFAVLEKVGGYVKGSGGNVGAAMFRFGQSYGFLRGCLCAAAIPYVEVAPATWQKAMGLVGKKGETKAQWKRRCRQKAEQLFPGIKLTNATADALLLAEYCRSKREIPV